VPKNQGHQPDGNRKRESKASVVEGGSEGRTVPQQQLRRRGQQHDEQEPAAAQAESAFQAAPKPRGTPQQFSKAATGAGRSGGMSAAMKAFQMVTFITFLLPFFSGLCSLCKVCKLFILARLVFWTGKTLPAPTRLRVAAVARQRCALLKELLDHPPFVFTSIVILFALLGFYAIPIIAVSNLAANCCSAGQSQCGRSATGCDGEAAPGQHRDQDAASCGGKAACGLRHPQDARW